MSKFSITIDNLCVTKTFGQFKSKVSGNEFEVFPLSKIAYNLASAISFLISALNRFLGGAQNQNQGVRIIIKIIQNFIL